MIVPFFLFVLFNNFLSASSEKCKSNNDCESGRCEWHRCVAKIGRTKSGRKEVIACYVDGDCNTSKGEICKVGSCVPRNPLVRRVQTNWECIEDEDCGRGHRCGMYRKCYDMSTGRYVEQSLMHIISCKNEAPSFCPKLTGLPDSRCQLIEQRNIQVQNFVCGYPDFDGNYDLLRSCSPAECPPYQVCIAGTCYNHFWATVGERCMSSFDCLFMAKCDKWSGQCKLTSWLMETGFCRVNEQCNGGGDLKRLVKICRRFQCMFRRSHIIECTACKFDEYCDLRQSCIRVQRFPDFDCVRNNWFFWYGSFYCSVRTEKTFNQAESDCKGRNAKLVYSPDRGSKDSVDPEKALLLYLAIRDGWVIDNADKVEKKFVNWANHMERNKKSSYFCKKSISRAYIPNNATAWEPKCQTSFSFHDGYCYHGGFTNFMPRFAIRTICNLLDSEIVRIKNKEEAHIVYGIAGGRSFWLGLRREKRDWYWDSDVFGFRARFFFWRTGQPDLSQGNCVYSPTAGEWMSADCDRFTSPRAYICKRAPFKD